MQRGRPRGPDDRASQQVTWLRTRDSRQSRINLRHLFSEDYQVFGEDSEFSTLVLQQLFSQNIKLAFIYFV